MAPEIGSSMAIIAIDDSNNNHDITEVSSPMRVEGHLRDLRPGPRGITTLGLV